MKYIILIFFISLNAFSLEIDEKLTLRFLKVSDSKKTVLINRGGEDGIIVGDHAKFFITSGVVARGVVEKVSPQRSIWSLYRIIDNSEIMEGKVLNLKIATPAKITNDPSKSLKEEIIPGGEEKMEMEELNPRSVKVESKKGENSEELLDEENEDKNLENKTNPNTKIKQDKSEESEEKKSNIKNSEVSTNKESKIEKKESEKEFESSKKDLSIYALLGLNSLSGTSVSSDNTTETSTASVESIIDITVGVSKIFLEKFSAGLFLHSKKIENGTEVKLTHSYLDFGVQFAYNFVSPYLLKKPIYNLQASVGIGNTTLKSVTTSEGASTEAVNKGSTFNYAIGFEMDYFFMESLGLKSLLQYHINQEKITFDNDVTKTQNVSGPSINLGIIYKF